MRCSIYDPILDSASSLEGRVRELGVNVKRVRVKRGLVVRVQSSTSVSRRAHMVSVSM